MSITHRTEPQFLPAGSGEHLQWPDKGHEFWIKLSSGQSDGLLSVVEATAATGARVGLHVHDQDDECYWILEGEYEFTLGERTVSATAGSFLFIPRGTTHSWRLGSSSGRVLVFFTPAGAEVIFRDIAQAKANGGDTPEDWARLGRQTHTRWLS